MERTSSPAVLVLPAEVSNDGIAAIDGEAARLLGTEGTALVVHLGQTAFLSSGALGLFVKWGKCLSERGGRLALVRPRPSVQRLLRAVGLDEILPWFHDVGAASAYVTGGGAR